MEVCHTVQKMFSASETFKFLILKLKKLPKPLIKLIISMTAYKKIKIRDLIQMEPRLKNTREMIQYYEDRLLIPRGYNGGSINILNKFSSHGYYVFKFNKNDNIEKKFIIYYLNFILGGSSRYIPKYFLRIKVPNFSQGAKKKFIKTYETLGLWTTTELIISETLKK